MNYGRRDWEADFKTYRWLQGEKIVPPPGICFEITFRYAGEKLIVEVCDADSFIFDGRDIRPTKIYPYKSFKWEDIVQVTLKPNQ